MGVITITWPVCVEMLSPHIRPIVCSYIGASESIIAFVALKTYANLLQAINLDATFLFFCIIGALNTVFILIFVPETKNKV